MKESLYSTWKAPVFKEGFNSAFDVNNNRGTVVGGVTFANGVATFNGTSGNIQYGQTISDMNTGITIRVRCKPSTLVQTSSPELISKSIGATGWRLRMMNGGAFRMSAYGTTNDTCLSSGTLSTTDWNEVVGVYDGVKLYVYKNGILDNSVASTGVLYSQGLKVNISTLTGATEFFAGDIELAEVYDYGMNANEVLDMYNNKRYVSPVINNVVQTTGNNLLVNGDFSAGTGNAFTGWTIAQFGSSTITQDATGGPTGGRCLRMTVDPSNSSVNFIQTTPPLTAGKYYLLSVDLKLISGSVGSNMIFFTDGGSVNSFTPLPTSSWATYTAIIPAYTTGFGCKRGTADCAFNFANMSIKECVVNPQTELLNIDAKNGIIADKYGNVLTNTSVVMAKTPSVYAMDFQSTTSRIACGTPDILLGDKSFSCWYYARSTGNGSLYGRLIDNGKFILNCNGTVFNFRRDGSGTAASTAAGSLVLGKWTMISVVTNQPGNTNLYINGVLSGTANQATATPSTGSTIYIGNTSASDAPWNGLISGVRLINGLLTAQQIQQLYDSERKYYSV